MPDAIQVTRPYLPPLEEFLDKVRAIYQRNILTNGGPESALLEQRLRSFLGVGRLAFVSNGTMALQLALRALEIGSGEIITTPFSYVATVSAILWERCRPVFADIDPSTFNIDPARIEQAISPATRAILPVHVFGHPCDMDAIEEIAARHSLPVIYDAAHAFGVSINGKSVCARGDVCALSFHATKPFHTLEGGACVTNDPELARRLDLLRRFGHHGDEHFLPGINAKQDEINAAMGNLNLDHLEEITAGRRRTWELYEKILAPEFQTRKIAANVDYNYAYFPLLFESEQKLLAGMERLRQINVFPRRYFYPALTTLPYIGEAGACPIAEDISTRIACLPLHANLAEEDVLRICEALLEGLD